MDQPFANQQMNFVFPKKLKLKNFQTKIISTQNIHFKKTDINNYYKKTPKKEIPKKVKFLNSIVQFENFLKKVKEKDIIFFRERSWVKNRLNNYDLSLFKKYNIKTIDFDYYPEIKANFTKRKFFNTLKFLHLIFRKIYQKFQNNSNFQPNYIISFGEHARQKLIRKRLSNTTHLDCPSFWIKFFKKKIEKKNFIVYVDENVNFSRDQYLYHKKYIKTSDAKLFVEDLNNLFDLVEKKYKTKIIIACSKKHVYKKNLFNDRKIIYGKTLELISKSKIVLGHKSDALFQSIYSNTPVILLRHKSFSFFRNLQIDLKSVNLFNKYSYNIEDYLDKKVSLDDSIDKNFYKKNLKNYFLSNNIKKQNFFLKFEETLNKLKIYE